MRASDWLKINLRLIFLICVQTQILYNGAIMCAHSHYEGETRNPYRRESMARLKALEALGGFMPSRTIPEPYF